MKRGTSADYIEKLLGTIREKIDNVAIRSTFIVGYPGETKQDFDILYKFIERQELDRVGVFTYSHEDGTSAFSMIDTVTKKEKERRNEELMLLQQDISLQNNTKKIGSTLEVLIDRFEDGSYIGRTQHDAPDVDNLVYFKSDSQHQPGDFVNVLIDRAEEYDIFGTKI
jgi:ribosomal protein S12 methylthiotransferase